MNGQDMTSECSSDVSIQFAESLQIYTGLLTVAIVFGVFFGIVTAALLYVFCLKPIFLTRKFQGYDPRRLFEMDDMDRDDNQSDCASTGKRVVQSGAPSEKDKKQPPVSSDVAAFALKAKVVYPINQRYRPLADGASNPSLHEHSKLPVLPNQDSSSSSSLDSLSQEKEDDDSSQFISSSPVPKTLESEKFQRAVHYPETLCYAGFEGRISLYCLGLQEFQHYCSQLQEEKWVNFLQILRIVFSGWFHKEKMDSVFYSNVLLMQERELEELKKERSVNLFSCEKSEEPCSAFCTVEDVEKAGRDRLEHGLQTALSFGKQVERLCQHLLSRHSVLPRDVAQEMSRTLILCLLLVEKQLAETQASAMKSVQERLQWWKEVTGWLRSRSSLLWQEARLRLRLAAQTLEQLTGDGQLTFAQMEKMLSELQTALSEELQCWSEECRRQTKELVHEKGRKFDSKKRKVTKTQSRERTRLLDSVQQDRDPQEFVKMYHELLARQRKQCVDFEVQQDGRVTEALCELWKRLNSSWSERLAELWRETFLTALPAQSLLPPDRCERLWREVHRELTTHLQREESSTKQQLEGLRDHLEREKQVAADEEALALACLRHLGHQQMKIVMAMVVRQRDLQESSPSLIEEKQRLLLAAVQRHFAVRHFFLRGVKEMRLSRLKLQPQGELRTLSLEECTETQPSANQAARGQNKDPYVCVAEQDLGPEAVLIGQGLQQELLSELETASELLQEHAQILLGHALAHSARQRLDAATTAQPHLPPSDDRKPQLVEAASESVYVTRDSVTALIHGYYSQIQAVVKATQQEQQLHLHSSTEESERQRSRGQLSRALQKELANWARKPNSSEFHQRVELQKKRAFTQYDQEQETVYQTLRSKKSALNHIKDNLKSQLQEAEESFMARLAALARVPLACTEPRDSDSHSGTDASLTPQRRRERDSSPQRSDTFSYDQRCLLGILDDKKRVQRKREVLNS